MQIESVSGSNATVAAAGTKREISVAFIDDPKPGQYVLVHAGFAIKTINDEEATETLKLLSELSANLENE